MVCETEESKGNVTYVGKEKNAAKKEKIKSYDLGLQILENRKIPETQIDKCRLVLYIHNKLKEGQSGSIRGEEAFFNKLDKQFKKGIDYEDIIKAIWTLHHNKFCNGETGNSNWSWDVDYIFDKRGIDKVWKFKSDKIDSEISSELRNKLKYILTLPEEFSSSYNSNKGISEKKNHFTEEELAYMEKNTVEFN